MFPMCACCAGSAGGAAGAVVAAVLAGELRRLAERPGLEEVLDRIERRQGGRVGLTHGGAGSGGGPGPAMIVLDAWVLANVIADDRPEGQRARAGLRTAGALAAPDLVDVDTVAVLRKRWRAATIRRGGSRSRSAIWRILIWSGIRCCG